MKNHIVAVVGMCGSGKSVITEYFVKLGYHRVYFGGVTMNEVKKRGLEVNPTNEKNVREELRRTYGPAAYAILTLPEISEAYKTQNVVCDGLYSWSEYKVLKEKYGEELTILAVVTNSSVRKRRLATREIRPLSSEEVENRDIAEIENIEKGGPIARADYYIVNNGSCEETRKQFDQFLIWLESK